MSLSMNYKFFPKGDARRYFVVLLAADRLGERATTHTIAKEIGCTRSESQRALEVAAQQFAVVYRRVNSTYLIESWGVLQKSELVKLIATTIEEGVVGVKTEGQR